MPGSETATENYAKAFAEFESRYGVPTLLDAEDPECCGDIKCLLMYLNEIREMVPAPPPLPEEIEQKLSKSKLETARRKSRSEISNGFAQMDAASKAKFDTPSPAAVPFTDRSAPVIDADVSLAASSELSEARKSSLSAISAQEDPERAEVVPAVDKSAPAIEPDTKLDNSFVKARRGSMKQIENRFR